MASLSDSKSLVETLPEAEFQYYAADLVHDSFRSIRSVSQPFVDY